MPSVSAPPAPTTPKKVLSAIHNLPRRVRSGTLRSQLRPAGKENAPPDQRSTNSGHPTKPRHRPAPLLPRALPHTSNLNDTPACSAPSSRISPTLARSESPPFSSPQSQDAAFSDADLSRWAAKDGKIIIKVWVPSTDDIWKLRVPEDVGLTAFRARVTAKLGFDVSFSALVCGTLRTLADDDAFREWVAGRVVNGRNSLLTAHRLALA